MDKQPDEEKPAESSKSGGGGWFSWYEGAKAKTISTFDLVKRDLNEFTETVGQQALATVDAVKTHAPGTLSTAVNPGEWVKSLVGTVNNVLQIVDTTEGEEKDEIPIMVSAEDDKETAEGNPKNAKLFALQTDPGTYLNEPSGAPDLFEDWLDHFNLVEKKPIIRDLLTSNWHIRRLYTELVPSKVSNRLFWERYFYKIHQYELDQTRIETMLQRTTNNSDSATVTGAADDQKNLHKNLTNANKNDESRDKDKQPYLESWDDDSDLDNYELTVDPNDEDEDEKTIKEKFDKIVSPMQPVDSDLDDNTCTAVLELEDKNRRKSSSSATLTKEKPGQQQQPITSSNASEWSRTNSDSSFLNDATPTTAVLVKNSTPTDASAAAAAANQNAPSPKEAAAAAEKSPPLASGASSPTPDNDFLDIGSENSFCIVNSGASSDNGDINHMSNNKKPDENNGDW